MQETIKDINHNEINELEEILRLQNELQDITNEIYASESMAQIFTDCSKRIMNLFNVEAVNIYAVDKKRREIYTIIEARHLFREQRMAVNNRTIPGYVADTGVMINVADVHDQSEMKSRCKGLDLAGDRDGRSNAQLKQVMATPIVHEGETIGIIEVINKLGRDGRFVDEEPVLLQEISEVLAIAFSNHARYARRGKTRFDSLIRKGFLKEEELDQAWDESREQKETMEGFLMRKYNVSKEDLGKSLEEFYRCRFFQFSDRFPIPAELLTRLNKEYLLRELWVPIEKTNGNIHILLSDPDNIIKRDMIENLLKTKAIRYDVALPEDISKYINYFYQSHGDESSISDIIGRLDNTDEGENEDEEEPVTESDSAIMLLVNKIINDAVSRRASDIHVEPNITKRNVEVRFRIDGDCAVYQTVPFSYRAALVSRIKIMSNLDITVKRIPQDGKIKFRRNGSDEIELRVATLPTQGGVEDVVMRLLAKGETLPLEAMGMLDRNYAELLKVCEKPYGMILVVGPTGSGKTTTLHAALRHINTPEKKIWTAEDPVEITQYGLRQVQVQPKIGFDFATAMRAFLRADPDVIMVGEMRDFETAKTGVEASLTGHLVFSTLHTNSAPETIIRLLDMGIDPLNFADALLGVLAQRLVRTLCKNCREPYHPTMKEYEEMAGSYGRELFEKLAVPYTSDLTLYRPRGCDLCDRSGYKGRVGIHELLIASDSVKRLIQKNETVEVLREKAMSEGMSTLLQDGIQKALRGVTDFRQVRRVCIK
ncbi:MAG: pilus assembly protein [Deltaproteobacteria bacterium HGW-Deltaproteobacteria-19]|jgi:type II secretory ATPase GspE/PulE/Tfp pilus assembly ATPase PilB-like protein|nr:MAG: pilus assembly protein [Deltaproteobacteria bacterium HGW-Deltaproteobacteria-19]